MTLRCCATARASAISRSALQGDELGIAAAVLDGGVVRHVEDVIHGVVEEGAVVADDQHRLAELAEVLLQPLDRLEIEVVGGLVEQHQVGRGGELRREAHAATLAAAQPGERAGLRLLGVEAESLEHLVDPGVEFVAARDARSAPGRGRTARGRPR